MSTLRLHDVYHSTCDLLLSFKHGTMFGNNGRVGVSYSQVGLTVRVLQTFKSWLGHIAQYRSDGLRNRTGCMAVTHSKILGMPANRLGNQFSLSGCNRTYPPPPPIPGGEASEVRV